MRKRERAKACERISRFGIIWRMRLRVHVFFGFVRLFNGRFARVFIVVRREFMTSYFRAGHKMLDNNSLRGARK